ncbi:molybdate ABC transporter substrate-binding protein [Ascidiimonas sp. W6]|uniref:molybdate ABC transporter substrate-binding protein n=1 Tax=Ascidiimonas meishanensis TaxID=3128903 RepID=UPI0030EC328C
MKIFQIIRQLFLCRQSKVFALLFTLSLVSGCSKPKTETITIAAASSMQFALEELIAAFKDKTGISCEVVNGASGMLTSQIAAGAPYTIFMSADLQYPHYLAKNGYTTSEPVIYGYGELILWSVKETIKPDILLATQNKITHIAIANPETAPYGKAAKEALEYYGLFEAVKDKLVYGENISQTNQFIASQAVEYGFTAKSVVLSSSLKNKGIWEAIDSTAYLPIAQGMVVLKSNKQQHKKALAFKTFLFSTEGRRILEKYGYRTPNKNPL